MYIIQYELVWWKDDMRDRERKKECGKDALMLVCNNTCNSTCTLASYLHVYIASYMSYAYVHSLM